MKRQREPSTSPPFSTFTFLDLVNDVIVNEIAGKHLGADVFGRWSLAATCKGLYTLFFPGPLKSHEVDWAPVLCNSPLRIANRLYKNRILSQEDQEGNHKLLSAYASNPYHQSLDDLFAIQPWWADPETQATIIRGLLTGYNYAVTDAYVTSLRQRRPQVFPDCRLFFQVILEHDDWHTELTTFQKVPWLGTRLLQDPCALLTAMLDNSYNRKWIQVFERLLVLGDYHANTLRRALQMPTKWNIPHNGWALMLYHQLYQRIAGVDTIIPVPFAGFVRLIRDAVTQRDVTTFEAIVRWAAPCWFHGRHDLIATGDAIFRNKAGKATAMDWWRRLVAIGWIDVSKTSARDMMEFLSARTLGEIRALAAWAGSQGSPMFETLCRAILDNPDSSDVELDVDDDFFSSSSDEEFVDQGLPGGLD